MQYVAMVPLENITQFYKLSSCIEYLDEKIEELDFTDVKRYLH